MVGELREIHAQLDERIEMLLGNLDIEVVSVAGQVVTLEESRQDMPLVGSFGSGSPSRYRDALTSKRRSG